MRFAPKGIVIPNMEVTFPDQIRKIALDTSIRVKIGKNILNVSNLELQTAYKEKMFKSPKDPEDARHIRLLLGKNINMKRLREYQKLMK